MRIIALILLISIQANASDVVVKRIRDAAKFVGVDADLLVAVCFVESSFRENIKPHIDGQSLSYGVCQVKLSTALHMDKMYKHRIRATESRLENPFINAYYAAKILQYQLNRYDQSVSLAVEAYNRGHAVFGKSDYVRKVETAIETMGGNK